MEQEYYKFLRMNLFKDHTARMIWDTFSITEEILLSVPTSLHQARAMDAHDFSKEVMKMISPGRMSSVAIRTMRPTVQFHQISGLVVGKKISLWLIIKTLQLIESKKCLEERQKFVSPSLTSHSQSHLLRWMFLASSVVEKAVTYVRKQVGSKLWEPVWFTHVPLKCGIDATVYSGFAFGL